MRYSGTQRQEPMYYVLFLRPGENDLNKKGVGGAISGGHFWYRRPGGLN